MSSLNIDGTIEEDFEEALAKEVELAGELGSPATPSLNARLFPGSKPLPPQFPLFQLICTGTHCTKALIYPGLFFIPFSMKFTLLPGFESPNAILIKGFFPCSNPDCFKFSFSRRHSASKTCLVESAATKHTAFLVFNLRRHCNLWSVLKISWSDPQ